MQMIPMAVPGAELGGGQAAQPASTGVPTDTDGVAFPELLKQATPQAPQKPVAQNASATEQDVDGALPDDAAEEMDLFAAVEELWTDLSQLASDAQDAVNAASGMDEKFEAIEGFMADLQDRLSEIHANAFAATGAPSIINVSERIQQVSMQFGAGEPMTLGPMKILERALETLKLTLPAAPQQVVPQVQQASVGPVAPTAAGTPSAPQVVVPNEPVSPQQTASAVSAIAAQTAELGTAAPATPTGQPVPTSPTLPAEVEAVPVTPEPDMPTLAQGEQTPRSNAPDTSKAALTNVALSAEAAKPVGQAPVMAQMPAAAPAPTAPVADAGQALAADMPTSVNPGKAAELAPAFSFARNVAAQVRGTVFEEGKTRVELTPRGLGDIEVEVARDDSGKLRVVLRAENPAVLTAFRNDRELIGDLLREGGVSVDDGEMTFESFGGHASYPDHQTPADLEGIEEVVRSGMVADDQPAAVQPVTPSNTGAVGALDITT